MLQFDNEVTEDFLVQLMKTATDALMENKEEILFHGLKMKVSKAQVMGLKALQYKLITETIAGLQRRFLDEEIETLSCISKILSPDHSEGGPINSEIKFLEVKYPTSLDGNKLRHSSVGSK